MHKRPYRPKGKWAKSPRLIVAPVSAPKILEALEEVRDALKSGEPLERRFDGPVIPFQIGRCATIVRTTYGRCVGSSV